MGIGLAIAGAGPFAVRGRLVLGPGQPREAARESARESAVIVDHGVVVAIDSPVVPARLPPRCLDAAFVAPGFVDLQVNGGFGWEVGGDPGALRALAQRLPATGVTTFLPTLISAREEDYRRAFAAFRAASAAAASGNDSPPIGARMPGMHLEGPLLAVARAGAHETAPIEAATAAMLERLVDPLIVRLVTLAPERAGAMALIASLKTRGVLTSLGHTDAPFDTFIQGVDAGATLATHLFNAMSPFHHRDPGATGAALIDDRLTALLIADGVHCHPAAFSLAARVKGPERLALVTDAIAAAGLPPGPSTLAGRPVVVTETSARLVAAGTEASPLAGPLAGSILTMDRAVRNAVTFAGVPAATALSWASQVPARAVGLAAAGRLAVGDPADIVLLDERLFVVATIIGGVLAHSNAADEAHARALLD
ncbi:MAG: N-acetylglucosamine-6-phosphate deacetylase [Myxococcales bacterium]